MSSPASAMPPPGVDPAEWLKIQRQSQIADFLQQDALTAPTVQQPAGGGKFYQAARVSPFQGLAKLAEALLARKTTDTANAGRSKILAAQLAAYDPNGGGPSPQSPVSAAAAPPPPGGSLGGFSGGPGASDAGQPGSTQPAPATSAVNPNNPFHLPARIAMDLAINHPDKFAELAAGTPEWRSMLAAYGGDERAAMQAMRQKAVKDSTITMRSGEEALIPQAGGGYQSVRTPNLPAGMDYTRDPRTQEITGAGPVPGVLDFQQRQRQAEQTGANQGEIHEFKTPGGGSTYSFGLPPNLAGAPKNYFPTSAGAQTSAPPAGTAPGAPRTGSGQQAPTPPGVTPGIWSNAPTRPQQSGLGEDPYYKGTVEDMVKKNAELSDRYGSEADLADQRIAFNNEALKVLGNADLGPLSDRLTKLRSMAIEQGIPASWIPGGDTVNDTTELKKFLLRNPLLSLKPTFGGRPAASEFQILANDASPSPQMLQGAITRLVQLDNQAAGFSKQRAIDYNYFHDQLKGNPQRFETWYANRVPFAKWLAQNPNGKAGEEHIDTRPPLSSFEK